MHNSKTKPILSWLDVFIIAAFAIGLSCCRPSHTYHTDHGVKPCDITEPLDSILSRIFPGEEPGGIGIVMLDGKIIYDHAFGVMNMKTAEMITDSTIFNLASASKTFTAVAMLKLQEQGKLNIDDPISKYFPEFKGNLFDSITIRHILTHSSGLPDLRPRTEAEWNSYIKSHKSLFVIGDDYRLYGREEEHMKIFQNLERTEYDPGTHYERHDPTYIMFAPLVERLTGIEFDTWMNDNVFKPAGLTNVFYYKPDNRVAKLAHAYTKIDEAELATLDPTVKVFADGIWAEYDYGEVPFFLTKADRGLCSSAKEFMRWNEALYTGKVISDSSLKAMTTPYISTVIPNLEFGLGVGIFQKEGMPAKMTHTNANGGFSIVESTWPDVKLSYAILSNRADWDIRAIAEAIDSVFASKGYLK